MDDNSPSIIFSMLVLLMLIGIQMIEAGSVRSKNVSSVFLRGLATLTISLVSSWICGYMFTHTSGHFFLGYNSDYLTLNRVPAEEYYDWVLYSCISSLCSAIVASSMSERTHITGHLILTLFVSLIIFPASAHWVWHPHGWLSVQGCSDLGGVLTVHLFSGAGALVGSLMVGPRVERLGDNFRDVTLPGHSLPLTAIGAMFVIIGMVGKVSGLSDNTGHVTVNTLVGGAAGCLVTMNLFKLKTRRGKKYSMALDNVQKSVTLTNRKWSFLTAFNGFYTGTISVCGVGQELPAWGAFIAGIVGGLSFFLMSGLLRLNKVDDPVHGIGVQLSGGVVGTLVVGLCNVAMTHDGTKIGWELVGLAVVAAWSCACFLIVLMPLLLCGKLRVKDCQEKAGIDVVKMKEPAYENSTPAQSDACPSRLPNLPRDGFLTPNTVTRTANMSCQLSAINKKSHLHCSRCSGLDIDGVSPRTVIELPSPGGSIQMSVPPPPPYPTSTMKKTDSTLVVPEVTITSSCISENDSEAPLINSMSSSLGMRDLKKNLRKQKEQLRKTTSKYKCSNDDDDVNSSIDSDGSVESVKSSVVRNVVSLANNRDNFNYLTATTPSKKRENQEFRGANTTNEDEINDTEIDITKYLKSPINKDDISEENASNSVVETLDVAGTKAKDGGKMFEASINFVSDDESDFDEKLI